MSGMGGTSADPTLSEENREERRGNEPYSYIKPWRGRGVQ